MPPLMDSTERRAEIAEVNTLWHEAPGNPVLYLHGVPTDGEDWLPFLERTGGLAPDLPGFGRSDKPPHFDYSIDGYRDWLRAFVDERELELFSLVMPRGSRDGSHDGSLDVTSSHTAGD